MGNGVSGDSTVTKAEAHAAVDTAFTRLDTTAAEGSANAPSPGGVSDDAADPKMKLREIALNGCPEEEPMSAPTTPDDWRNMLRKKPDCKLAEKYAMEHRPTVNVPDPRGTSAAPPDARRG